MPRKKTSGDRNIARIGWKAAFTFMSYSSDSISVYAVLDLGLTQCMPGRWSTGTLFLYTIVDGAALAFARPGTPRKMLSPPVFNGTKTSCQP